MSELKLRPPKMRLFPAGCIDKSLHMLRGDFGRGAFDCSESCDSFSIVSMLALAFPSARTLLV